MTNRIKFFSNNSVGIWSQKSQTSMNLKWPCLISADWSCSCCSSVTLLSRRHELFWMAQILNTFVRLVRGEALGQFDTLSAEVWSTAPENLMSIILGLGKYFPPVNAPSKQKCAMRRRIRITRALKGRWYDARLINLNDYFDVLPGATASNKICETDLKGLFGTACLRALSSRHICMDLIVKTLL